MQSYNSITYFFLLSCFIIEESVRVPVPVLKDKIKLLKPASLVVESSEATGAFCSHAKWMCCRYPHVSLRLRMILHFVCTLNYSEW